MNTITGLHHDVSRSQVHYRVIKSKCVNKEKGVMSIECVIMSILNKATCLPENRNLQDNNVILGHQQMFVMKAKR